MIIATNGPEPGQVSISCQEIVSKKSGNVHTICTRSKAGVLKPKVYVAAKEPTTVGEALQQEQWKATMTDEFLALMRNGNWSLIPLPEGRRAISCKCVFKVKKNQDGTIYKYKARGFHQDVGFDFNENFSHVVK